MGFLWEAAKTATKIGVAVACPPVAGPILLAESAKWVSAGMVAEEGGKEEALKAMKAVGVASSLMSGGSGIRSILEDAES